MFQGRAGKRLRSRYVVEPTLNVRRSHVSEPVPCTAMAQMIFPHIVIPAIRARPFLFLDVGQVDLIHKLAKLSCLLRRVDSAVQLIQDFLRTEVFRAAALLRNSPTAATIFMAR